MARYGMDYDRNDYGRGYGASGGYGRDFDSRREGQGYGDDFTSGSRSYNTKHRDWHINRGWDTGADRGYTGLDRGWAERGYTSDRG